MRRRLLTLPAALVTALALSAVVAVAAQAAPTWRVNGAQLKEGMGEAFSSAGGPFVLSVPGRPAEIKCGKEKSVGTLRNEKRGGVLTGVDESTIEYSECVVAKPANCIVGKEKQESIIFKAATILVEAGGKIYDQFSPVVGAANFTTVNLSGLNCGISGAYELTGSFADKVGAPAVWNVIEFSKAISEAAGTALKFGGFEASLTGRSEMKLTGANKGTTLGAK